MQGGLPGVPWWTDLGYRETCPVYRGEGDAGYRDLRGPSAIPVSRGWATPLPVQPSWNRTSTLGGVNLGLGYPDLSLKTSTQLPDVCGVGQFVRRSNPSLFHIFWSTWD